MSSIPLAVALAAAVIVPVVGTGVHYLVNQQKSGTISREVQNRPNTRDSIKNSQNEGVQKFMSGSRDSHSFLHGGNIGNGMNLGKEFEQRSREIMNGSSVFTEWPSSVGISQFQQTNPGASRNNSIQYQEIVTEEETRDVEKNGRGVKNTRSKSSTRSSADPKGTVTVTQNTTRKGN